MGTQFLGTCYLYGRGVTRDDAEAVRWYEAAAGQGDLMACYNLGQCREKGRGCEKDLALAAEWYRKALDGDPEDGDDAGRVRARYYLGMLYLNGNGVPQDFDAAIENIRRSAEDGFAKAQYQLGLLYQNGEGVEQDAEEAQKWFDLAKAQGYQP